MWVTNFLVVTHKPTDLPGEVLNCQSDVSYFSMEQVGCRPSKLTSQVCPTNTQAQLLAAELQWATWLFKLFADLIYQKKPFDISISSYKAQKQRPNLFSDWVLQTCCSSANLVPICPFHIHLYCQVQCNTAAPLSPYAFTLTLLLRSPRFYEYSWV